MKKQGDRKKRKHNERQLIWERYNRQSMENVSSANGWLKGGYAGIMNGGIFFYPGILH